MLVLRLSSTKTCFYFHQLASISIRRHAVPLNTAFWKRPQSKYSNCHPSVMVFSISRQQDGDRYLERSSTWWNLRPSRLRPSHAKMVSRRISTPSPIHHQHFHWRTTDWYWLVFGSPLFCHGYGLFMHFGDTNHELTRMQQEEKQ